MVPPYLHIIQFHTRPDLRYVYSLLFRTTSPSSSQLLARVLDVVVLSVQGWLRGAVPFPCAHVLDRRLNGRRTNVGLGRCECWLPRAPLLQHVSVFFACACCVGWGVLSLVHVVSAYRPCWRAGCSHCGAFPFSLLVSPAGALLRTCCCRMHSLPFGLGMLPFLRVCGIGCSGGFTLAGGWGPFFWGWDGSMGRFFRG